MRDVFLGRSDQVADLMALWRKRVLSFVTCRGRRRIGKCQDPDSVVTKLKEEGCGS